MENLDQVGDGCDCGTVLNAKPRRPAVSVLQLSSEFLALVNIKKCTNNAQFSMVRDSIKRCSPSSKTFNVVV